MGVKRYPRTGTLCKVYWLDVVGYVNAEEDKVVPANVISVGYIHKVEDNYIVLASAYYTDKTEPGERVMGDFTALPKGMIGRIETLSPPRRKAGKRPASNRISSVNEVTNGATLAHRFAPQRRLHPQR